MSRSQRWGSFGGDAAIIRHTESGDSGVINPPQEVLTQEYTGIGGNIGSPYRRMFFLCTGGCVTEFTGFNFEGIDADFLDADPTGVFLASVPLPTLTAGTVTITAAPTFAQNFGWVMLITDEIKKVTPRHDNWNQRLNDGSYNVLINTLRGGIIIGGTRGQQASDMDVLAGAANWEYRAADARDDLYFYDVTPNTQTGRIVTIRNLGGGDSFSLTKVWSFR